MSPSPSSDGPLLSIHSQENRSASHNVGDTHSSGEESVSQLAQQQSIVPGQHLSLPNPVVKVEKDPVTSSSECAIQDQPSTDYISSSSQGQADNAQRPAGLNVPASVLQSKFKQHSTSWLLAVLASSVLAFSTWYVFTVFISEERVPQCLRLSPGRTIITINILTHVVIFLVWQLVDSAFEALRWTLASRDVGVLITTFLAMSRATGFSGIADLLRIPGWHRVWCIQRLVFKLLCWLIGLVLLSDVTTTIIYTPENGQTIDVVAGLAPFNAYSPVPVSVIDIYYMIYTKGILMDSTLVTGIPPLTCSGSDCTSFFLPGGLTLVRLANGGSNSTLYEGQQADGSSTVLVNNAPGYHLEFYPVAENYVFNSTADCAMYGGTSNEAIHICVAANGTQILAGWSICPSDLFVLGLCFNETSWTDQPDESTTLVLHKRYATVAYDRTNFSILSIESIKVPEPATSASTAEVVANLTHLFSVAFSSIPTSLNTSDPDFPTDAATFIAQYDIGWALRLYQDLYRNYPGGPLSVLQSFLAVPIQFSTTAWQATDFDSLPSDLKTTASPSSSAYRAFGKLWMLIVFAVGAGVLILWAVACLTWVAIWGPLCPNASRYPEIDIVAKSRIPVTDGWEREGSMRADFEALARQSGMGNGESRNVRASFRGKRLFVGAVEGSVVLATEEGQVVTLNAGQSYH